MCQHLSYCHLEHFPSLTTALGLEALDALVELATGLTLLICLFDLFLCYLFDLEILLTLFLDEDEAVESVSRKKFKLSRFTAKV